MPHKHTRRERDQSAFDLPPSQIAKPLPVRPDPGQEAKTKKRKRDAVPKDDAPRAFKRLMAYAEGKKPRPGLDNGTHNDESGRKKKKKNKSAPETDVGTEATKAAETPKIKPGERMSEFAARVDAALPLGGLVTKSVKGSKDPLGFKAVRTRKEKKMHKLYEEWREQERKLKEEKEEELELQAEQELEDEENGVSWRLNPTMGDGVSGRKKKNKKKGGRYLDETAEREEDPWEALKKKRGEAKIGLQDVVLAPPELVLPKMPKKLTVRGAAVEIDGVPKAAGSLRRREELQTVRDDVIASYRKSMADRAPRLPAS